MSYEAVAWCDPGKNRLKELITLVFPNLIIRIGNLWLGSSGNTVKKIREINNSWLNCVNAINEYGITLDTIEIIHSFMSTISSNSSIVIFMRCNKDIDRDTIEQLKEEMKEFKDDMRSALRLISNRIYTTY